MTSTYPDALDVLNNPSPTDDTLAVTHSGQHSNANDAIEKLEAYQGIRDTTSAPAAPARGYKKSGVGTGTAAWYRNGIYDLREWGQIADYGHDAGGIHTLVQTAMNEITTFEYEADGQPGSDEYVEGGILRLPVKNLWFGDRVTWKRHVGIEGPIAPVIRAAGSRGSYYTRIKMIEGVNKGAFYIPMQCEGYSMRRVTIDGNRSNQGAGSYHGIEVQYMPSSFAITATASNNRFTKTAHGLIVGDRIVFTGLTGGSGVTPDTFIYWINSVVDANNFTVSTAENGSTLSIGTNISAGTALIWAANAKTAGVFEDVLIKHFPGVGFNGSPLHLAAVMNNVNAHSNTGGGFYIPFTDGKFSKMTAAYNGNWGYWIAAGNQYMNAIIAWQNGKDASNAFTSNGYGIRIETDTGGYSSTPSDITIDNSFFEQSAAEGMYLGAATKGVRCNNVSFRRNNQYRLTSPFTAAHSHVLSDATTGASNTFVGCHFEDADGNVTYDIEFGGSAGSILVAANDHSQAGWRTARTNTPGKLISQLGSSSFYVSNNGLVNAGGAAFPSAKSTNDKFFRTDLGMEFYWDGTRWLSTQVFQVQSALGQLSASNVTDYGVAFGEIYDHWIEGITVEYDLVTTSASSGNSWQLTVAKRGTGFTQTTIYTSPVIDNTGGSNWPGVNSTNYSQVGTFTPVALGAAGWLVFTWTKVGGPGNLRHGVSVRYRIIGT